MERVAGAESGAAVVVPPVVGAPLLGYATPQQFEVPEGWTNVEVFGLRAETLRGFLATVLALRLGTVAITYAVLVVVFCGVFHTWRERLMVCGLIGTMLLIRMVITVVRVIGRTRRQWQTFRLVIAEEGLVHSAPPRKPITVRREEVRQIVEGFDSFRVWMGGSYLHVPKRAERPERIRERLAAWQPIQERKGAARFAMQIGFGVLCPVSWLAALLIGCSSAHLAVVAVCSVLAIGLGVLVAVRLWRMLAISWWAKLSGVFMVVVGIAVPVRLVWMVFWP